MKAGPEGVVMLDLAVTAQGHIVRKRESRHRLGGSGSEGFTSLSEHLVVGAHVGDVLPVALPYVSLPQGLKRFLPLVEHSPECAFSLSARGESGSGALLSLCDVTSIAATLRYFQQRANTVTLLAQAETPAQVPLDALKGAGGLEGGDIGLNEVASILKILSARAGKGPWEGEPPGQAPLFHAPQLPERSPGRSPERTGVHRAPKQRPAGADTLLLLSSDGILGLFLEDALGALDLVLETTADPETFLRSYASTRILMTLIDRDDMGPSKHDSLVFKLALLDEALSRTSILHATLTEERWFGGRSTGATRWTISRGDMGLLLEVLALITARPGTESPPRELH